MIYVQIADSILGETHSAPVDAGLIKRAAQETSKHARPAQDGELTLVLTDDAQLHALNRQFLGIDAPTDVLSFPADELDPDSETPYLGDVVVSYPRALAQAAAEGHPVQDAIQLLVVQGVLHLLGSDHAEESEKQALCAPQAEISVSPRLAQAKIKVVRMMIRLRL